MSQNEHKLNSKPDSKKTRVVVIGGGFGGLSVIQQLAGHKELEVCLIDRRNHHLFQPLLYQVAMAGLNPSDIAIPFRKLFRQKNVHIIMAEVENVDLKQKRLKLEDSWMDFDYLVLACGSKHFYFGNNQWEEFAPGLKNLEQATEIRRRVFLAFELAEKAQEQSRIQKLLTFVIVGAGPTGVELAGAIAEMTHKSIHKDFKNADLRSTRVILVEAGSRVLAAFPEELSEKAKKDLEKMGVEVVLNKFASELSKDGLKIGDDFVEAQTVTWAAGVKPSQLTDKIKSEKSKDGRLIVNSHLSLPEYPSAFVVGDQAAFSTGKAQEDYLPTLAPVAIQEGRFVGKLIKNELRGKERSEFKYFDKGIMATIGRSKAVVSTGSFQFTGFIAWIMWVAVHINYIVLFKNKFFVLLQWIWSYFSFGKGASLIVHKTWKFYSGEKIPISDNTDSSQKYSAKEL